MIKSLIEVMNCIIRQREVHIINLLKALPLLHLLRGDCTPHEHRVVHPAAIVWTDSDVDLKTAANYLHYKRGLVMYYVVMS